MNMPMKTPPQPQSIDKLWNRCQYNPESRKGHYESYFLRANHPTEPQAFWIRYTLFAPKGNPHEATGEIWAIYFNDDRIVAVQEDISFTECKIGSGPVNLTLGENHLERFSAHGKAQNQRHQLSWALHYQGQAKPLLLLPENFYSRPLPKAKSLVGIPQASFTGQLEVNGETIDIRDWKGSENHNWGTKHTDEYAWGQVCGFDQNPEAFLEVATARIHLGPLRSPRMTLAVLRLGDREYRFNNLLQAISNQGKYHFSKNDKSEWHFSCQSKNLRLSGRFLAPSKHFVGLHYRNPPGGLHTCLNCKIAQAEITLEESGQTIQQLSTQYRAAFEILTDDERHGVTIANPMI